MIRPIDYAALLLGLLMLIAALVAAPARAAEPPPVLGAWLTPDGDGVVAIEPCGDALCGRIVGVTRDPGDPEPTDVHGAPQCGLTIISDEHPDGDGTWLGDITDPRTGNTYGAKLWLGEDGNLRLRGFVGLPFLGETQTWHPFKGRLAQHCEIV